VTVALAARVRGTEAARAWRAAAAAGLAAALLAVELVVRTEAGLRWQIAGQLVAFAVYLPAAGLCWRGLGIGRRGVVLVLGVAVVLRAVAFDPFSPPSLSNDPYRYAWDARVQAIGVSPYRYPPDAPELRRLRDTEIWPNLDKRDWLTAYPPGAEASFLAARAAFGHGVRATTWLFLLAEGAAFALLLLVLVRLRAPPERVAVAAWHPLAVSEIAANSHVDALALLAGAVLLAAWTGRGRRLAGVAVGFGTLVKLGPVFLAPALARGGGRRFVLAVLATVGAGYALYATAGRNVLGSLVRYLSREDLGSLAWWGLAPHLGRQGASVLLLFTVLAIVAVVSLRAHDEVEQVARTCLLVLGALLLAVRYLQPWYGLWLLPFLAVTAAPAWLWLTGTLPLLYTYGLQGALPGWVRIVIYLPFGLLSLAWLARPRVRRTVVLPALERPVRIAAVVPAIDEAEALPRLLGEFPADVVDEIVVVDGGSRDGTPEVACAGGARVVVEPRRGYGRACLTGLEATDAEIVVFLDGDGSDDPAAIPSLIEPILAGRAALVLGARNDPEPGAQHAHQRLGNRLVCLLLRACYQLKVRDIPPMRAMHRDQLLGLAMTELTYGWPTEMVVKAARSGLPLTEVSVPSRPRRGGRSKVSGRLGPSIKAGARMLAVVARYA
jgi:Glycosyl transferase family 2